MPTGNLIGIHTCPRCGGRAHRDSVTGATHCLYRHCRWVIEVDANGKPIIQEHRWSGNDDERLTNRPR